MEGTIVFIAPNGSHGYLIAEEEEHDRRSRKVDFSFRRDACLHDFGLLRRGDPVSFWISAYDAPSGAMQACEVQLLREHTADDRRAKRRLENLADGIIQPSSQGLKMGVIAKLAERYGFIESGPARHFFPASKVAAHQFQQLAVGAKVSFVELPPRPGDANPIASDVRLVCEEAA